MEIPTSDRLSGLPHEILRFIIKQVRLPSLIDLKNLCEVSKILYVITLPFLYEGITIECYDGFIPGHSDTRRFSRSTVQFNSSRGLDFVKDLHLVSKFHDRLRNRCYHHRIGEEPSTADIYEHYTDEGLSDDGSLDADHEHPGEGTRNPDADMDDSGVTDSDEDADWNDDEDINFEEDYGKAFLLFCQKLRDDSLRAFRYNGQDYY
jgi:hypothetical protein